MEIVIISEDKMKKLRDAQERHEMDELRAKLRIESIEDGKERFRLVGKNCDSALSDCEQAYIDNAEDASDSFETAIGKAEKTEKIEREHDRWIAIWENQVRRLNWEARQIVQP